MLNRCIVTKQMKKSGIYQLYIQYNLTEIYSSRLARFQMKCPVVVSFVSPIFTEALPGGSWETPINSVISTNDEIMSQICR